MNYIFLTAQIFIFTFFTIINATTLHVPSEYLNIQSSITASEIGDTVLVATGTYFENISFEGKDIVIISEMGSEQTIIDGSDNGSVVTFAGGESENAGLIGFTIWNGSGTFISFLN